MLVQTNRPFQVQSFAPHRERYPNCLPRRQACDETEAADEQPTALLVEHRDEVFARLATDLAEAGMRVVRAKSAIGALKLYARYAPSLVLANVDLPDQSGWLLTAKLRFVDPDVPVWLYYPRSSPRQTRAAAYLAVGELLDYGGDLLGLSDAIVTLMANHPIHA